MERGAQSVTMDGQLFKLVWCVDSWAMLMMVNFNCIPGIVCLLVINQKAQMHL